MNYLLQIKKIIRKQMIILLILIFQKVNMEIIQLNFLMMIKIKKNIKKKKKMMKDLDLFDGSMKIALLI